MRGFTGLVGLVVTLAGGYFFYNGYLTTAADGTRTPPQQQIDVIAIRGALQIIAQSERRYLNTHGVYASVEQLKEEDLLPPSINGRGYVLSGTVDGNTGFTITAAPSDSNKAGWPTLSVDQTMKIITSQ